MEINMVVEADNLVLSLKEGKEVISVMYINLKMLNNGLGLTELKNIYTKKDYRRQGLMERLMKETFEVIQEERQPLTVMVPNDEKIFKKYGFNYISCNFDIIIPINIINVLIITYLGPFGLCGLVFFKYIFMWGFYG